MLELLGPGHLALIPDSLLPVHNVVLILTLVDHMDGLLARRTEDESFSGRNVFEKSAQMHILQTGTGVGWAHGHEIDV